MSKIEHGLSEDVYSSDGDALKNARRHAVGRPVEIGWLNRFNHLLTRIAPDMGSTVFKRAGIVHVNGPEVVESGKVDYGGHEDAYHIIRSIDGFIHTHRGQYPPSVQSPMHVPLLGFGSTGIPEKKNRQRRIYALASQPIAGGLPSRTFSNEQIAIEDSFEVPHDDPYLHNGRRAFPIDLGIVNQSDPERLDGILTSVAQDLGPSIRLLGVTGVRSSPLMSNLRPSGN